jgi:hypothetical protein
LKPDTSKFYRRKTRNTGFQESGFLQKFSSQNHLNPVDAAIYFIRMFRELDAFHHSAPFQRGGCASYFKVFDEGYIVAILKQVSIAVAYFHWYFKLPAKRQNELKKETPANNQAVCLRFNLKTNCCFQKIEGAVPLRGGWQSAEGAWPERRPFRLPRNALCVLLGIFWFFRVEWSKLRHEIPQSGTKRTNSLTAMDFQFSVGFDFLKWKWPEIGTK